MGANDPLADIKGFIGARVKRTEDGLLLRGQGMFADDIHLPNALQAAFVRSPHGHARIRGIDTAAARKIAGVHAVYTWRDLPDSARQRIPMLTPNPAIHQPLMPYLLAKDEVCFAGDPVAVVIADNRYIAEDAANAIDADYEVLSAVSDARAALRPDSPRAHLSSPDNLAASLKMGFGDVDAAFAGAAHIVRESFWQNRGSAHPLEARAYVAEYHPVSGELTVWSTGQAPFLEKKNLIDLLDWDPERLRVVMNDVGGGFGPKGMFYGEEAVVAIAAWKLGRPVKWTEDRHEHFLTATQERDQFWDLELALDGDGKLRGVKLALLHDNGAHFPWGIIMPYISVTTTPGPYVVPAMSIDLKVAFTNKVATTPVRGAGRPQAVFAMERMMDKAARQLGLDRAEIRRRNFIQPSQMPYSVGFIYRDGKPVRYDSGDYPQCQATALAAARYESFPARKAQARAAGRFIGMGMGNYVEGTGLGPFEGATVRVQQNGRVTILTGASPQGQGHKTTFRQIAADQLGVPLELVDVTTADTRAIPMGIGTFASRITVNAGSSVFIAACNVREKVAKLAAAILQVKPVELAFENGWVFVAADPAKRKSFAELARVSQGMPGFSYPEGVTNGLEDTQYFSPAQAAYCNGTAVVELEVDPEIGQIRILNYVMGHDSGKLINPLIVDGQVQGAVAHGIGNATLEWMRYDENAQPLTATFAEYLMPGASDVPRVDTHHLETPSPLNPLGVKGAGEGGTIPAAAAIVSAIEDALSEYGLFFTDAPLTPPRLVQLLRNLRR